MRVAADELVEQTLQVGGLRVRDGLRMQAVQPVDGLLAQAEGAVDVALAGALHIGVVGFAELFCFATRLAYMSLFVTAIGMVITLALTKRGSAKVCAVLLLCAAVCAAGYTVSPIHRNQQAVAANAVRKQENIDRLVAQGKAEFGDQGYAYLTYAYDEYLGGTVERYGL